MTINLGEALLTLFTDRRFEKDCWSPGDLGADEVSDSFTMEGLFDENRRAKLEVLGLRLETPMSKIAACGGQYVVTLSPSNPENEIFSLHWVYGGFVQTQFWAEPVSCWRAAAEPAGSEILVHGRKTLKIFPDGSLKSDCEYRFSGHFFAWTCKGIALPSTQLERACDELSCLDCAGPSFTGPNVKGTRRQFSKDGYLVL